MIKSGKSPITNLYIKYKDKEISNLSSTVLYIWNSGNNLIKKEDIVELKPLRIFSPKETLLDARVLKQSDESNGFEIVSFSESKIQISFDYLNVNEGVKLQVLHTEGENDIQVDCKIDSVK